MGQAEERGDIGGEISSYMNQHVQGKQRLDLVCPEEGKELLMPGAMPAMEDPISHPVGNQLEAGFGIMNFGVDHIHNPKAYWLSVRFIP